MRHRWSHRAAYTVRVVYEEAAPWTAEGFAAMPTFDPAWFPRVEPEPGEEGAEPIEIPEVAVEEKRRRFQAYLRNCQPSWPSMPRRALACLCSTLRASAYGASPWSRGTRRRSCRNPTGISSAMTATAKYPWNFAELCTSAATRQCLRFGGEAMRNPRLGAETRARRGRAAAHRHLGRPPRDGRETIEALAEMPDGVYVNGHLAVITTAKDPIHWLTPPSLRSGWVRGAVRDAFETDEDGNVEAVPKTPPEPLAKTLCARGFWPGIRQPGCASCRPSHWPGASATSLATMPRPRCGHLGDELDIPASDGGSPMAMERLFRYAHRELSRAGRSGAMARARC